MKHVGALILLSLLGACSREQPDTGDVPRTVDGEGRVSGPVAETSTKPAEDAAPTEVAVQRTEEDARVTEQRTEANATDEHPSDDANAPSPQPPSDSPKTMK